MQVYCPYYLISVLVIRNSNKAFIALVALQGFIQNQQRAKSERDPSILPDLCSSHKKQLEVMLENHQKVCDILRRVRNAKQELCAVMHARIRSVVSSTSGLVGNMVAWCAVNPGSIPGWGDT